MKHLKNFENFNNDNIDEAIDLTNLKGNVNKFFTGHKGSEDKSIAKERILSEIDNKLQKLVDNDWIDQSTAEVKKDKLIKQAKENNWKGKIKLRKSPRTGKLFVVYDDGVSGLQNVGSVAAASVKGNL